MSDPPPTPTPDISNRRDRPGPAPKPPPRPLPKSGTGLGTGQLMNNGDTGTSFVLSKSEWLSILTFANDGINLPTDNTSFCQKILDENGAPPTDLGYFKGLISLYAEINTHCNNWNNNIYPNVIGLVDNVVTYGREVPPFIHGIKLLVDQYRNEPNDEIATEIKDGLQALIEKAKPFAIAAEASYTSIINFSRNIKNDKDALLGTDGNGGLTHTYRTQLNAQSTQSDTIRATIGKELAKIGPLQKKYNHDVILMETSATYAWIFPFGTIAAAIVLAKYGIASREISEGINKIRAEVKLDNKELQANLVILSHLTLAGNSIKGIDNSIEAVLPAIKDVRSNWQDLQSDLGEVVTLLDQSSKQGIDIVLKWDLTGALTDWKNITTEAQDLRANAWSQVNMNAKEYNGEEIPI